MFKLLKTIAKLLNLNSESKSYLNTVDDISLNSYYTIDNNYFAPIISNVQVTSPGSGYTTSTVSLVGSGGSAGTLLANTNQWSTSSMITGIVSPGCGLSSGNNWQATPPTPSFVEITGDLIISDISGNKINVSDVLKSILEHNIFLIPNYEMLKKYPSLNDAWNEYKQTLQKNIMQPDLQSAIENYKMIESLVKIDNISGE